jgi:hypothetical protein
VFILILLFAEAVARENREPSEKLVPHFGHPAALDRKVLSPKMQNLSINLKATSEFQAPEG